MNAVSTAKEAKSEAQQTSTQVQEINTVITELPSEYVKTTTFEAYKTEVNQKLFGIYTIKGSVADFEALQAIQNKSVGDVYNLLSTGANYVYTADGWDKLSETIDLSNYYTKEEIDNMINNLNGGTADG